MKDNSNLPVELDIINDRRIKKSIKLAKKNPDWDNLIVLKDKSITFVQQGYSANCRRFEGYIKLPASNVLERISDCNIAIRILPKNRMIVNYNDHYIFRGYKSNNTEDFMLLLNISGEDESWTIIDIDGETLPMIAVIDRNDDSDNSVAYAVYKATELLLKNSSLVNVADGIDQIVEGDNYDEDLE